MKGTIVALGIILACIALRFAIDMVFKKEKIELQTIAQVQVPNVLSNSKMVINRQLVGNSGVIHQEGQTQLDIKSVGEKTYRIRPIIQTESPFYSIYDMHGVIVNQTDDGIEVLDKDRLIENYQGSLKEYHFENFNNSMVKQMDGLEGSEESEFFFETFQYYDPKLETLHAFNNKTFKIASNGDTIPSTDLYGQSLNRIYNLEETTDSSAVIVSTANFYDATLIQTDTLSINIKNSKVNWIKSKKMISDTLYMLQTIQ